MVSLSALNLRILICRLFNKPLFILKVENGIVTKAFGFAKPGFILDCIEIVKLNNFRSGFIYAANGKFGKPVLRSSKEVPGDMLQQLRNAWGINS